jgi:hypothetical protein
MNNLKSEIIVDFVAILPTADDRPLFWAADKAWVVYLVNRAKVPILYCLQERPLNEPLYAELCRLYHW